LKIRSEIASIMTTATARVAATYQSNTSVPALVVIDYATIAAS
jgi:hypothetical protein